MMQEFEYTGVWWLPSSRDNKITGRLQFNQDEGAILQLDSSFIDPEKDMLFNPAIINGVSSTGVNITLHKCLQRGLHVYDGGQSTSEFYAHYVFTNIHFEKHEDITFHCMKVHYSRLDEWLNITGFDTRREGEEIVVRYKCPNSIMVLINDELRLEIEFHYSYSPFVLKEADLKQTSYIRMDTINEKHFDEFQSILRQMQNFLTLATMEPVYPSFIIGVTDFHKESVGNEVLYPQVGIFYQLARFTKAQTRATRFEPLFAFKNISDKFESLLRNWFAKGELLEPVQQLYFGLIYNPSMYLEQKFLCSVQAVEAYHRRTANNKELPTKDHKQRIKKILDNIPQQYKGWLTDKLSYTNEPSLKKRLQEIIDNHSVAAADFIRDKDYFIKKVVDTRNYLTHYTPKLASKAAKKEELHQITERLKILIEACLLSQMGFTQSDIHGHLYTQYRHLKP